MHYSYAAHPPSDVQGNIVGRGKYVENGREYSNWHKGKYLFPVDEVRAIVVQTTAVVFPLMSLADKYGVED